MDTSAVAPPSHDGHNNSGTTGSDINGSDINGSGGNSSGEVETQQQQPDHRYPVEFRGQGGEYFKIWIVNILLSIATLYIYSAWAKVRNKRYFYGNTFVDNSSFEYHATGGQILKGRIVAIIALLVVGVTGAFFPFIQLVLYVLLFLLIPWIIWRSIIFNARMSSYRNVRYGFTKRVGGLYWSLFKCLLIPVLIWQILQFGGLMIYAAKSGVLQDMISDFSNNLSIETLSTTAFGLIASMAVSAVAIFFLVLPWLHRNLSYFALNGYRFGTAKFSASLSTGKYYAIYIGSIAVAIGLYLLIALPFIVAAFIFKDDASGAIFSEEIQNNLENIMQPGSPYFAVVVIAVIALYLLLLFISLVSAAYLRGKLRNYRYQQTTAGDRVSVQSTVRTWPFARLLFTNLLLLINTLGLAYPWTRVRLARYLAANTMITCRGTLDGFINTEEKRVSSMGDELGEAFDLDIEFGL